MKSFFLVFNIVFFSLVLHSEIVVVPRYNYSIFPLEDWSLQPYENESNLSWLSFDNNIALSVTAWEGEKFSDLNSLFTEVSQEYEAYGNCVQFKYLDMDGAIGEVTFKINNKNYKGWMLFLNGQEFDYHIVSFTLEDNYDEFNNEIRSGIDSFSVGVKGELSPGPISTFLNASPSKVYKDYDIDFFGHNLIVNAAEYDFSNSQSIIEREADIMLNYSTSPELFYNAWKRYYKIIFRDNYERLEPLYISLYPYFADNKYSDYDLVELLMFWIQSYNYQRNLDVNSDLLNPLEASITRVGDCDARSIVLGILLHKFGIESLLLTSEKVKHALLAVNIKGEGQSYTYNGNDYLMVELTTKALIGEIKESIIDPKLWTPVEMEYSNGL